MLSESSSGVHASHSVTRPSFESPGKVNTEAGLIRTDSVAESTSPSGRLVDWDIACKAMDSPAYRSLKRAIDVVGALIGLVILGPAILVAMLIVRLEDGGPVIFRQQRVGLNGDIFAMFKIRTMVKDAESRLEEVAALNSHSDARTFKAKYDPRVLRCGKTLRKFSIDEFPQLLNVLAGDMSLVGPRPPLPREVELYSPEDYVRLMVLPGLTCLWQISGRGNLPFDQQVQLDRQYIETASTFTDLCIIARTVPAMFRGTGAH